MALTDKQENFIREYLVDLNATQAAIRAGYSVKTAYSQGQRLLKNVEIQVAIEEAMNNREKRTEVTQDMVVQQLAKIAFADIKDSVEWDDENGIRIKPSEEVDGTILASVSETEFKGAVTKEIKFNDRMRALEMLGRHLGMFKDKIEHSGSVGVQIVDDVP